MSRLQTGRVVIALQTRHTLPYSCRDVAIVADDL